MSFAERFENLEIWQQAQELAVQIYSEFGASSPSARDLRFNSQIQAAAVSISNNIAEGFDSGSNPEFARFLRIAKRSCAEVRSMFYLAVRLNYLSSARSGELRNDAEVLSKRIAAFTRTLK
ncbi:four helix bundle protein [Actomonas aquatica]|uniref:Four helix bundle protein n=1 Tax=Actomonas aquatica TaxID=2866162 RepID=A0ABZ1CBA3_9BACT|nr:four helix bundle protein [Opitutus sp. WL0086]WRQ88597.1 four helix bundle protein [Opitutus sp. WL0086]